MLIAIEIRLIKAAAVSTGVVAAVRVIEELPGGRDMLTNPLYALICEGLLFTLATHSGK